MSKWAAAALVVLAVAWLPGQGAASVTRGWVFVGVLPLAGLLRAGTWRRLPAHRVLLPWLVLAIASLVATPLLPRPGSAVAQGLVYLGLTFALALGIIMAREADAEHKLGVGASIAGAMAAACALLPWWPREGLFGNADLLGGFLALTAVWTVATLIGEALPGHDETSVSADEDQTSKRDTRRVSAPLLLGLALSLAAQTAALAEQASLGAWAALGAGATALLAHLAGRRWGRAATAMVVVLGLAVGMLAASQSEVAKEHIRGRVVMWNVASEIVMEQPLLGTGAGQFPAAWMDAQAGVFADGANQHHRAYWTHAHHAHNEVLQVASEMGILGALLFVFPVLMALAWGSAAAPGAWSATVAAVALAMVATPMVEPATAFVAALGVGLALGASAGPSAPRGRHGRVRTGARGGSDDVHLAPSDQSVLAGSSPPNRRIVGVTALVVALAMTCVASTDLVGDRLLVRGVELQSPDTLALSQTLSLRPERAMQHEALLREPSTPRIALALSREAAQRDPSPRAWVLAGNMAFAAFDLPASAEAFEEALRLQPWHFSATFNMALVWQARGDLDQARVYAERARALKPDDPRLARLP